MGACAKSARVHTTKRVTAAVKLNSLCDTVGGVGRDGAGGTVTAVKIVRIGGGRTVGGGNVAFKGGESMDGVEYFENGPGVPKGIYRIVNIG